MRDFDDEHQTPVDREQNPPIADTEPVTAADERLHVGCRERATGFQRGERPDDPGLNRRVEGAELLFGAALEDDAPPHGVTA